MIAALVAGSIFVVVQTYIVLKTIRWPNRYKYLTYYFARINLWFFALPMLIVRLRFWGKDFSELHFLKFSGPEFHRWSEWAYLALVAAVVVDKMLNRSKTA